MPLPNKINVRGFGSTFTDGAAIAPSDANDLGQHMDAFCVTASGTIKFDTSRGTALTIQAVAGTIYHIGIKKVYATGTTATGIVGLQI